jgi:hypothetical protein
VVLVMLVPVHRGLHLEEQTGMTVNMLGTTQAPKELDHLTLFKTMSPSHLLKSPVHYVVW